MKANLSVVQGTTLWTFDAGISRGVRWFGGFHDAGNLPGNAPHGDFFKTTFDAGVSRGFAPLGIRMQLSSNVAGQWSNDVLYPSEQVAVTGPFAVRGYRDVSLFGDRGFTWRNELGFPLTLAPGALHPLSVRPYLGADYGQVWSHDGVPGGHLSSGTVGAHFSLAPVMFEVSWSEAARRSSYLPADHYFFARFVASF